MQHNPQKSVDDRQVSGKLVAAVMIVSSLISLLGDFYLYSFKAGEKTAVSGQLLEGGAATNGSWISNFFDYFGNVTYFVPWLLTYVVYLWARRNFSLNLKSIDNFAIGVRLLGVTTSLIGFCMLFSGLVMNDSLGAGGILGDYLNIANFSHLPRYVAPFVPVLLSFAGVMLMSMHSPIWFCDQIGRALSSVIPFMSNDEPEAQEQPAPSANVEAKPKKKAFSFTFSKVKTEPEKVDNTQSETKTPADQEKPASSPRVFQGFKDVKQRLNKGAVDNKDGGVAIGARVEPSFGVATSADKSIHIDESAQVARQNAPRSYDANNYAHNTAHQEPSLGSINGSHNESSYQNNVASNNRYNAPQAAYERNYNNNQTAAYSNNYASTGENEGASVNEDRIPATRVYDARYAQANYAQQSQANDNSQVYSDDINNAPQGPSTIISGASYGPAYANEPQVQESSVPNHEPDYEDDDQQSTIITKSQGMVEGSAYSSSANQRSAYAEDNYDGPIYEAGAPGAHNEVVGNPSNRGEISTVITRGQSVTKMQFGHDIETIASQGDETRGGYAEFDSEASIPQSPDVMMPEQELLARDDNDDNAFSFTDEQEENESAIKNHDALRPATTPISEHDTSYSNSYTGATRGLGPNAESVNLPSYEKDEAITEHYDNEEEMEDSSDLARSKAQQYGFVQQSSASSLPNDNMQEQVTQAPQEAMSYEEPSTNIQTDTQQYAEAYAQSSVENNNVTQASVTSSDMGQTPEAFGNETANNTQANDQMPPRAPLNKIPTKVYQDSMSTANADCDPNDNWRPSMTLLRPSNDPQMVDEAIIQTMIERINRTLGDYKVQAKVANYQPGPVITRYDLELARGTKFSSIKQLESDLARNLTTSVRVLDTVPGTSYVGLEIPNPKRKLITLRDVVESEQFINSNAKLPLCLGVSANGIPVVADLAKAPHLLIAGTTGSGKSAGINSMLLSMLLTRSPNELRLILVDPKMVEFSLYQSDPHLICPVISETEQTMAALQWCVGEMERRYALMSKLGKRSIDEYNAYIREQEAQGHVVYDPAWTADMGGQPSRLRPLPAIVMVIDEFADLMDSFEGGKKKSDGHPETLVRRLAQKARAAALHLMLATQSPRSTVITGTLKANLPSRVAFTVQSALDSRVILDEGGAETLLGNGDMLAKFMGLMNNQLFRAHGPFASNEDVSAIVNAWNEHCGDPNFIEGVTDVEEEEEDSDLSYSDSSMGMSSRTDVLYDTVLAHVLEYQNQNNGTPPSISSLQADFGIGYPRAKKLFAMMKKKGDLK